MVYMWMEHFGGAGHSKVIASKLSDKGLLIGIDRDKQALEAAAKNLNDYKNIKYIHGNHDDIEYLLNEIGINKVDGIREDLSTVELVTANNYKDIAKLKAIK